MDERNNVKQLEAMVAKLKTEKFKLAQENLAQAERIEALHSQGKSKGAGLSTADVHSEDELQAAKVLVEERESQIVKLVDVNHILSAQVRFLSCHVFEAFEIPANSSSSGDRFRSDVSQAANPDSLTLEHAKSVVASLEAASEGTRAELRVAMRDYAAAELRISDQQDIIEGLQSRIEGISKDLDNASGSAGALRDQMKQCEKDVTEYKTMLLSANKKLRDRQQEIQVFDPYCVMSVIYCLCFNLYIVLKTVTGK